MDIIRRARQVAGLNQRSLPAYRAGALVAGGVFAIDEYLPVAGTGGGMDVTSAGMSATQGWFAIALRMNWDGTSEPIGGADYPYVMQWGPGFPNGFDLAYEESTNRWILIRNGAGGYAAAQTMAVGRLTTVIFKWTAAIIGLSVDGAAFATGADTSTTAVTESVFSIGCDQADARQISSYIRGCLWGNGTVSDEQANLVRWLLESRHPHPAAVIPAEMGLRGWWDCRSAAYRTAT